MTKPPTEIKPTVYSNADHELDKDVAELLKEQAGKVYAQHAAWDFCGYVWFDGTNWQEEVWVYRSLVETRSDEKLEDLIESVCQSYGHK